MVGKLRTEYLVELPFECDIGRDISVCVEGITYACSPRKAAVNVIARKLREMGFPEGHFGIAIDKMDSQVGGLESWVYEFPRVESTDGEGLYGKDLGLARTMALAADIASRRKQEPNVCHMQEARRLLDRFKKLRTT